MKPLDKIHHCTREMERYRLSNPRTAREFQLHRRLLVERLTKAEKAKLDSDNKISLALQ
jgi:hypothetical protein